jgi:methylmalonyl-CoA mutase N-terminal domain/subunit
VNEYINKERISNQELRRTDPKFELKKIRELKKLKKDRDQKAVKNSLDEIRKACHGSESVMPVLIKASKARVTLGEMIGVMKEVFGGYNDMPIF